jgi:hypothetical protein
MINIDMKKKLYSSNLKIMEENFYDKIFYKFQIKHLNLMKIINMKTMNRLMNLINADNFF